MVQHVAALLFLASSWGEVTEFDGTARDMLCKAQLQSPTSMQLDGHKFPAHWYVHQSLLQGALQWRGINEELFKGKALSVSKGKRPGQGKRFGYF